MRLLLSALCSLFMLLSSCANIVPPSGGKKDVTPPKLVKVTPVDSLLNTRPQTIELEFDEYITVADAASQIQLSPLLPIPLTVTNTLKRVIIHIPDTMLLDATTYHLTFGHAISDLHENNPWSSTGYTFSTGTFFDSLRIGGKVILAPTGLPDTSAIVALYSAAESDSAVVRHRPLYVTHTDISGRFILSGLPPRSFRLFALHDANNNLTYDGSPEWIAFEPEPLTPRHDTVLNYTLHTYPGKADSARTTTSSGSNRNNTISTSTALSHPYIVTVDTSDTHRRTQELNKPITILFQKKPSAINSARIFLAFDSSGVTVEAPLKVTADSSGKKLTLTTTWHDNSVYTLRLQKGFAKDSAGNDLFPGRYPFRTKREEDYGTLRIDLPSKYYGPGYVLQVVNETDTIHQAPVLDTVVNLRYLSPGKYTIRVIEDLNRNGKWDAGDLFTKKQPEIVIPYDVPITLKAGWDNRIDFEKADNRKPLFKNR